MDAVLDQKKVQEKKVEYVLTLRSILREISTVNRSPENMKAVDEIEAKLNSTLTEPTLMPHAA